VAEEQEQLKKSKPEIKLGATVRLRKAKPQLIFGMRQSKAMVDSGRGD
jgi:hypothetical protein